MLGLKGFEFVSVFGLRLPFQAERRSVWKRNVHLLASSTLFHNVCGNCGNCGKLLGESVLLLKTLKFSQVGSDNRFSVDRFWHCGKL